MKNVLFICIHNSARSQMAEAFLRQLAGDRYRVQSAGYKPSAINPLVVQVMAEAGLDLATAKTQAILDVFARGDLFDYVVSVCTYDEKDCPVYPGITQRLHRPFTDPAALEGSDEEKLAALRIIRDSIKTAMEQFIAWESSGKTAPLPEPWAILDKGVGA